MKIKTKLTLGVGLLFVLIFILSLVSSYYVFSIKKDTKNILTANYNTLEYSRSMLLALDNMNGDPKKHEGIFEQNLRLQEKNISEKGELEVTNDVQKLFDQLKQNTGNETLKSKIRQDIFGIMRLNMDAIREKSIVARRTAEAGNLWIAITGTLCFLIAFNLLVNLPNHIANPLKELTESIRQIANKNYSERVHFMNHDEFGDLARSFNTMAQKLQEYNSSNIFKLSFEKKRLETLINNMHDPIIGLDESGKILFVNDEALKVMSLKSDEVIGKAASSIAVGNDLLKSLVDAEQNADAGLMKIYADGRESYFEKEIVNITITPTGEDRAIDIGNVIILRNITAFKELDFAKTNFIATVSHELKTPIASIKMSLQLLGNEKTGTLNDQQQQLAASISEDSQRLLRITGELLELSQLETGNINLDIKSASPYEIAAFALNAVSVEAKQKDITVSSGLREGLPNVVADPEKTAWVLINFLTNAIRYSPTSSKVVLNISKEGNALVFSVRDWGKGIEKRYLSKVFDKYFRVPGSVQTGTGLGLAISRDLIQAQNGTIGLDSELGSGSTFSFRLDIASET